MTENLGIKETSLLWKQKTPKSIIHNDYNLKEITIHVIMDVIP